MKHRFVAILILSLSVSSEPAAAQVAAPEQIPPVTPSDPGNRMAPDERQKLYERYFHEVCEAQNQCNDVCKEVYDKVERKDRLKLKC